MFKQALSNTFVFMAFFAVGTAAFILAILAGELHSYYAGRSNLQKAYHRIDQLEQLNSDYDAAIKYLATDPNVIARLAGPTLGREPNETDTAYPKASLQFLAIAKQAVAEKTETKTQDGVPRWLKRCNQPKLRWLLFTSGICLILTSFVCFRMKKQPADNPRG